jgi:hypothetical protein
MSSYDRRNYQRPPGERTADPSWVDAVEAATGRRGRYRVPSTRGHGDRPIYGDLSFQYRALPPQRPGRGRRDGGDG